MRCMLMEIPYKTGLKEKIFLKLKCSLVISEFGKIWDSYRTELA